jgi:UDP:flavonoid glycosyltransferase YjiC (YdhE family)
MASIAFMALGSLGDINPLLGTAQGMQARGHDVTFVTTPYYEDVVCGAGLAFLPIGTREQFTQHMANPHMWSALRFVDASFSAALSWVEDSFRTIESLHRARGLDAVAIQAQCFGAQMAGEKFGIPVASLMPYPVLLQTIHDPVHYPVLEALARGGPMTARLEYFLINAMTEKIIHVPLNRFRAGFGMAPVRRFTDWVWQTDRHLGLWPDFMRGAQMDCFAQLHLTGFIEFDGKPADNIEAPDEKFLARKPIAFTLGTAMLYGSKFFAAAAEAMAALPDQAAYFLTRYPEQLPRQLPANVRHLPFAPFASLLPRCSAIVHHGGIGTAARALAASIPQLIVPFSFDQVDNAHLLRRIGVADRLTPGRLSGPAIASKLAGLIHAPQVQADCARYAARLAQGDGRERACLILEEMVAARRKPGAQSAGTAEESTAPIDSLITRSA